MIEFQDFLPQIVKQGRLFGRDDEYQSFSDLLFEANQWIAETQITVLNIETVILRDKDPEKARFMADEPYCYQFVRVWYEAEDDESSVSESED